MPNWESSNQIRLNDAVITVDNSSLLVKDQDDLQVKKRYNLKIAAYISSFLSGKKNIANTIANVATTSVFPLVDVVFFGAGPNNRTGTIPTSLMIVGQTITVKRITGSTGTLTLQGQSGQIQALNNTLGATTSLAAAGAYGQAAEFIWNGTNLLRINNG